jgi:2-methylcitrate dehydratase PrpD
VHTLTERFARFATDLSTQTLDDTVIHHTKRAVIDWYAALLPGLLEAPSPQLQQVLADDLDRGPSTLALGRAASPRAAALIQGSASHAVEFDDIFRGAIYHPGAPTISAAWALAQATGADGMRLLRAIIAGYEVSTRIGAALGRAHYRFWHNTGTVGAFGAASACASLLGLDARSHAHALATVGTFAAGLQQAFRMDSMSKPLHAGRAAEAGLIAAQMAQAGITGSLDILEGESGLGRAMSDGPDWERVLADLGTQFNITEMTFKNHGCCGHTFAAIDGTLELQSQLGVSAHDIERVRVSTYGPALAVAANPSPVTAAEARFSLPFVVATALRFGSVRLLAFSPDRLADPETRALMNRIELAVDPELDARFPNQRAARIQFELRDGRSASWLQPTRKGDPDAPLSDAELDAKFLELASPVIGEAAAKTRLGHLWQLDRARAID